MYVVSTYIVFVLSGAIGPFSLLDSEQNAYTLEQSLNQQLDSIYRSSYFEDFEAAKQALQTIEQKAAKTALLSVQISALLNLHYCAQYHGAYEEMAAYLAEAKTTFEKEKSKHPAHTTRRISQKLWYADGNAAYRLGEYEEAIQSFKKILVLDSLTPLYEYKCLSYIGHAYANLDHSVKAIDFHRRALKRLPDNEKSHYYQGVSNSYLGVAHKKLFEATLDSGLLKQAQSYYLTSLRFFEQSSHKSRTGPISCYTLLSEVYSLQGMYDSSAFYLKKAQQLDPENPETSRFWGWHHHRQGQYQMARASFLKSNELIEKKKGPRHYLIGRNLIQVGRQYDAEGLWERAIETYQQAFSFFGANETTSAELLSTPQTQTIISHRDYFECLRHKAHTMLKWAKDAKTSMEERKRLIEQCIHAYVSLAGLLDTQRSKFVSMKYKQFISAKALTVYEKAISACHEAINLGLKRDTYIKLAFDFAEKNKNRQLREASNTALAIQHAGIPDSVIALGKGMVQQLRYTNSKLNRERQQPAIQRDSLLIKELEEKAFELSNQWERFDEQLAAQHPDYYQFKNGDPAANLKDLQIALSEDALLLEYFYGDSEAFVFAVSGDQIAFERIPRLEKLEYLLSQSISDAKKPSFGKTPPHHLFNSLHQLTSMLLPLDHQLLMKQKQLVIIPDGMLGYLPFEMLMMNYDSADQTGTFLLEDFTIHYAFSSHFIGKQGDEVNAELSYLGFAPSYNNPRSMAASSRSGSLPLPGALRYNTDEVMDAHRLFSGKMYLDTASTELQFKKHAKDAAILHFSMHARVDDENPDLSKLIFHPPTGTNTDAELDGNLHLYELYGQQLQAQLAVLSACNTGDGQLRRGEGIGSLGRAFRYAGCSSIVMSLWEAHDKHTTYIMSRFFQHLKAGDEKDTALRKAKLDFLTNPTHKYFRHPYYWAPFILMGEPSSLSLKAEVPYGWVFSALFVASAVAIFFVFKKRM